MLILKRWRTKLKIRLSPTSWWLMGVILCGAGIYLSCLPSTLQELDSNELAMAGYGLYVPHPPGYPLFVGFNYLLTHLLPCKTIYFRAALGSVLFMSLTWYLLGKSFGNKHPLLPLWLLLIAFIPVVWRYALLPDVFAAHLFLLSLFLYFYLKYPFARPNPKKALWLVFLAALGGAHHQTFIFLSPLLLPIFWKMPIKVWVAGMVLGILVLGGAYSLLMLWHPTDQFSWAQVTDLKAVWAHVRRQEYGTWQLRPGDERPFSFWWPQIKFWWHNFGIYFLPFLAGGSLPLLCGKWKSLPRPYYYLGVVLLAYILIFLGSINFGTDHLYGLVAQRFHLMSGVLLGFWFSTSLPAWPQKAFRWLPLTSILLALTAVGQIKMSYAEQDLSRNTIIEDYARNILDLLPHDKPVIYIAHGDTRLFALRYLQATEHLRPDVLVMADGRLFPASEIGKYPPLFQKVQITPAVKGTSYDFTKDILLKNIATYHICTDQYLNNSQVHTTYYSLGRCFSPGQGISFAPPAKFKWWRHNPAIITSYGTEFQEDLAVFVEYAIYYLKQGVLAAQQHQTDQAQKFFAQAAQMVPYALPASYNQCQLLDDSSQKDACLAQYQLQKAITFDYLP